MNIIKYNNLGLGRGGRVVGGRGQNEDKKDIYGSLLQYYKGILKYFRPILIKIYNNLGLWRCGRGVGWRGRRGRQEGKEGKEEEVTGVRG